MRQKCSFHYGNATGVARYMAETKAVVVGFEPDMHPVTTHIIQQHSSTMRATLLGIFILAAAMAYGQGGIKGYVFDEATNEPMWFATAHVVENGVVKGATVDEQGNFCIQPLEPGTYDLTIEFAGMHKLKVTGIIVKDGSLACVHALGMQQDDHITYCCVGYCGPHFYDAHNLRRMPLKTCDLLETPLRRDPVALIGCSNEGIQQQDQGQPLYVRGGRPDGIKYILDGMVVDKLAVPSSAIGEITVLTGGIPAQYGDVLSSVIIVETKSYFDLYNQYNY